MTGTPIRVVLAAVVLGLSSLVGCSVYEVLVPRHGWSEEWGPMVPHETFPADCGLCHRPRSWDVLREDFEFDHLAETGHALEGAHSMAACLRCHNDRGPVQEYLARGCGGCHVDPHRSELGLDCTKCHDQDWWQPVGQIAEHNMTRFPLVASHALASCESCHPRATQGQYRGAPVECHLCHQQELRYAQPNHVVNNWIRDCDDCHDVGNWRAADFQHLQFPLVGGHAGLNCNQCHAGGRVQGTPNDCYSCHRSDYLAAPDHVAQGFSTNCVQCHNVYAWR